MTRLWVFSDLHQEIPANAWLLEDAPAHDVIVAAGDIDSPLHMSLAWLRSSFPFSRIVYVPGNHDYWCDPDSGERDDIERVEERGRQVAREMGIDLLIDDTVSIGDVRFVGATLWTDFRLRMPDLTTGLRTAGKGMNDYRRIRRPSSTRSNRRIRPEDLLARHRASRAFIESELAEHHPYGPTVVVTHHAPTPPSFPRQHASLHHAYASDMDDLIERYNPNLWIHGHIHQAYAYGIVHPGGLTRVRCNPRGHVDEREGFDPALIVEV